MYLRAFNYSIEIRFSSLQPWSHMKLRKWEYGLYYSFVWGKLSIIFGQPHLVEHEVCEACYSIVERMGEDGISVCEECGIMEGHTITMTEEELENAQR